jgi:hypothetical protein
MTMMSTDKSDPGEFIDREEAGEVAHQSVRTVDRWLRFPTVRSGSRLAGAC